MCQGIVICQLVCKQSAERIAWGQIEDWIPVFPRQCDVYIEGVWGLTANPAQT